MWELNMYHGGSGAGLRLRAFGGRRAEFLKTGLWFRWSLYRIEQNIVDCCSSFASLAAFLAVPSTILEKVLEFWV